MSRHGCDYCNAPDHPLIRVEMCNKCDKQHDDADKAIEALTAGIAELREENERLRVDLSVHQQEGLIVHTYEVETLTAENKRLRDALECASMKCYEKYSIDSVAATINAALATEASDNG